MRGDGLLTGHLWNREIREMVKVRNKPTNASKLSGRCGRAACQLCHDHPVGKARAKTKGRRNKLALSIDDDWSVATTSSRNRGVCSPKVKVSSHALDYDLDDAYDIYAACRAIDVACGAKIDDHTFDIDASCHAIDVACAFDINAACDAIDIACAVNIPDVDNATDSCVDGNKSLATDLACHIDDAVVDIASDVNHAFHDSSCDDGHDHENYDAHDIHHVDDTTVHTTIDDDVRDDGLSADENDDTKYDAISDTWCVSSIDDGETSVDSSGWYHVATLDTDEWYLC